MKKALAVICGLLLLCGLLPLSGCSNSSEQSAELFAMNTYMSIKTYGDAPLDEAKSLIRALEQRLSVTNPESEISRINTADGAAVTVSAETAELIQRSLKLCERTGGALDITIYPVLREWGFTTGEYKIPDNSRLAELSRLTGYGSVSVNGGKVSLPKGFMLDLGAVAKGYACDQTLALLKDNGVSSAIINLGGNIYALGSRPDSSAWKIGVADPSSPDKLCGTLSLTDKAAVTSGGYERYFTGDDGVRYCHIIDPDDCRPADNGASSVTIVGDSGILCDALSTALFVMGKEQAIEHWRTYRDFEMVFVDDSGKIAVTEGLEQIFEPVGEREVEIIR